MLERCDKALVESPTWPVAVFAHNLVRDTQEQVVITYQALGWSVTREDRGRSGVYIVFESPYRPR